MEPYSSSSTMTSSGSPYSGYGEQGAAGQPQEGVRPCSCCRAVGPDCRPLTSSSLRYGTLHKLEPLPESLKQQWADPATLHPALHLPPPNDFIPRDFSLRCDSPPYCELPPEPTGHPSPPNLIKSAQGLQMYHKLDR